MPSQAIGNLNNLSLTGTVTAAGDSWSFSTGGTIYAGTGDNAVNAAAGWNAAEFCIVGNAGGGQANFNSGSKIVTRTKIVDGGTAPPLCVAAGFTGETNNLSFGPTAPAASPPGPALLVTESVRRPGGDVLLCGSNERGRHPFNYFQWLVVRFSGGGRLCTGSGGFAIRRSSAAGVGSADLAEYFNQHISCDADGQNHRRHFRWTEACC